MPYILWIYNDSYHFGNDKFTYVCTTTLVLPIKSISHKNCVYQRLSMYDQL